MQSDFLIIGAGIVGCAIARVLSRYQVNITVLDRGADLAEGASKANSGIVHAGFDAHPGTLKAKLNVAGAQMYPALAKELGVPYQQAGAMVLAFQEEDRATIETLYQQGIENGVPDLRIIEHDEILQMEPNTNPQVICALYAPTSGLVSPYEMTFALADHAAVNGVQFRFEEEVTSLSWADGLWQVSASTGTYQAKTLINCAGISSGLLHNQLCPEKPLELIPRRGQYYLLDRCETLPFSHTMFQCPTKMGKGVLVSPTVHGNIILGPSAEDIEDPQDTATTAAGLAGVLLKSRLTWPAINTRTNITNFSGIRSHERQGDFVIGKVAGQPHAYETVGIESPGLTSAPAIADYLAEMIVTEEHLQPKNAILPPPPPIPHFHSMTYEERMQAVAENPLFGQLVCRCEQVTEAEILAAIHRPVGARTIDGVKRRTRAGMGRCQGGFCSPRVAALLAQESHIDLTEVTKCGGDSRLLTGTIQQAMKEAAHHEHN